MNLLQRIFLGFFVMLFLSLTLGVEIYSVHCNMRGETFVTLKAGMDPCLLDDNFSENSSSCCSINQHCALEDDDKCCDEEQIHLSFEPDAFSHLKVFIPSLDLVCSPAFTFIFQETVDADRQLLAEFPQPPPIRVRERLTKNCVWRI